MSNNELTIRLDPEQIQELKDFIASLKTTTTPQPQPEPPAVGVTVEELAELLVRLPFGNAAQTHYLLNHPRLGPLLRGEGRRRVELPETPPFIRDAMSKISGPLGDFWRNGYLSGWLAARAALARQQGVG